MLSDNFIIRSDSYKMTHWMQYPEDTAVIYSYFESRGGESDHTVFFGLQYYLQAYLKNIVVTAEDIDEAEKFAENLFGNTRYFNRAGWEHIVNNCGGRLPIKIMAVPEGSVVNLSNIMMSIENTDHNVPWLTNVIETMLMKVWYTTGVATLSHNIRNNIQQFANRTGGSVSPFALNDFGYRGATSEESAGLCGMAHLLSFYGTDNNLGIAFAHDYYGLDGQDTYGHSVFATEHSTTTVYGEENEIPTFANFIEAAGKGSIVSLVADSYDYRKAVEVGFCQHLKDQILEHGRTGGRVVIRPDSGDPIEETLWTLETLAQYYDIGLNDKGFKVLPMCIGIIYGDGINEQSINAICTAMEKAGWAIDGRNVIFGMGTGLHQSINRDTHQFAIKCSARLDTAGDWHDVFKQPKTMSSKGSKRGRLRAVEENGIYKTLPYDALLDNALEIVFQDGNIVRTQSLTNIRSILND